MRPPRFFVTLRHAHGRGAKPRCAKNAAGQVAGLFFRLRRFFAPLFTASALLSISAFSTKIFGQPIEKGKKSRYNSDVIWLWSLDNAIDKGTFAA